VVVGGQRVPPALTTTELWQFHGCVRRFTSHFSSDSQRWYGGLTTAHGGCPTQVVVNGGVFRSTTPN